jgi:DNA-binding transcriptional MerR regulator
MDPTFTLAQLTRAAAQVLAHAPPPADERVSAAPDERTLRWYQTTGLLDRPLRYDGRTAIYGWRHLLQACAVKLLQASGQPLADVQRALAGVGSEPLEAAVAEAVGAEVLADVRAGVAPVAPVPLRVPVPAPVLGSAAPIAAAAPAAAPPPSPALVAAEVAPGVTVLVDPRVVADPAGVVAAVRALLSPGGLR